MLQHQSSTWMIVSGLVYHPNTWRVHHAWGTSITLEKGTWVLLNFPATIIQDIRQIHGFLQGTLSYVYLPVIMKIPPHPVCQHSLHGCVLGGCETQETHFNFPKHFPDDKGYFMGAFCFFAVEEKFFVFKVIC